MMFNINKFSIEFPLQTFPAYQNGISDFSISEKSWSTEQKYGRSSLSVAYHRTSVMYKNNVNGGLWWDFTFFLDFGKIFSSE